MDAEKHHFSSRQQSKVGMALPEPLEYTDLSPKEIQVKLVWVALLWDLQMPSSCAAIAWPRGASLSPFCQACRVLTGNCGSHPPCQVSAARSETLGRTRVLSMRMGCRRLSKKLSQRDSSRTPRRRGLKRRTRRESSKGHRGAGRRHSRALRENRRRKLHREA